ncbi:acyltransferase [Pedobacter sp. MC2016-24]|uniref:acyltransferase family protein n=1 Tax=Pedobacter sp. MC2016-24 TaxID=2780090 RepID=UPI00187EB167|nr:acyltransferase [Pedobacter sp. MC2016-24]MBE9601649.1 acyltransferase [Pedobacter sp. MC2016-24]
MTRLKELDVLRGVAAFNVLLFHYLSRFKVNFNADFMEGYSWNIGQYGVQLFFMISGFVIFMSLQGDTTLESFAYKRFSRLYPSYWICACVTFAVVNLSNEPQAGTSSFLVLLGNLTMVQGQFNVKNIDGAYWSLVPELLFYCLMGVLFKLGLLTKIRVVALIWLALIIGNQIFVFSFGAYLLNLKYGMFFLSGMLFYNLKVKNGDWHEHVLIAICWLTALMQSPSTICLYVFSLIFLLFYLFTYGLLKAFTFKPFLFLGYISYPLYLLHQNIGYVLILKLNRIISNEYLVILITFSSMVFLAWIVTHFIEKPILHFLRNYHPLRKQYLNL